MPKWPLRGISSNCGKKKNGYKFSQVSEDRLGMSRQSDGNVKNLHRFAMRYAYHWLPSEQRLKRNNQLEDDGCPLCGQPDEKSSHFIKCKHRAMEKGFGDAIGNS